MVWRGGATVCTCDRAGLACVAPLSLSSLASWHKAHLTHQKWTQQSPHGCSLRLYAFLTSVLELYDRHEAAQLQKRWIQKKAQQSGVKFPCPAILSLFFP